MSTFEGSEKKAVSVGPFGGQHGLMWDDGVYSTVKQLVIAHGSAIDSIQIEYDEKGTTFWSDRHGGNGGWKADTVKFACPEEYLTLIEGHYGKTSQWGPVSVRSLTFKTNKRIYGPFGIEKGTPFSIPEIPGSGKIVGFHGRAGWYIDAIGAYINPLDQNENQPSKALHQTQFNNYTAGGTDNLSGYSVLQNCDVFFAIRPKFESSSTNPPEVVPPRKLTRQFSYSGELSDVETKVKTPAIERCPSKVEGVVTYGPWGGTGGSAFDDGVYSGIRQIKLSRNVGVVLYINVQYDRDGDAVWGGRHGGTGGYKHDKIIFNYPSEILTHITGTIGPAMMMGPNVIKSLTFHTTRTKHGPYGEEQGGIPFTTKLREGKIVGIHGKSGLFLDALGVHAIEGKFMVETHTPPVTNTPNTCTTIVPKVHAGDITETDNPHWTKKLLMTNRGKVEEATSAVIKEPAPCGPGPWGGDGGRSWDDGVFCGIRQIHLTRAAEGICSMQIEYDRMGQFLWSVKHGGDGGTTPHRIKLEYPHEVLTCITGYYGCISRDERLIIIKSLSFYTSRGKYGPFGEEVGTFFTSTTTEGKVVGLHGRSSLYLDAIGVHMQHWLGNSQRSKPLMFKMF